jgi:hypothetical protein
MITPDAADIILLRLHFDQKTFTRRIAARAGG